jgi:hypothetical protein
VAATLALATVASAADLWDALGPARIGASKAEITEQLPLNCEASGLAQRCTPVGNSGNFDAVAANTIELTFEDARLTKVSVTFGEQYYEALLRRLVARFGPGEDRSFRARAGMGGEFIAGVYLWGVEGIRLVLEQFAGKIDRSALVYGTDEAMADLVREKTAHPAGARHDL